MKIITSYATLILISLAISGCSTTSSGAQYKASMKNIVAIKDQVGSLDKKVKLEDFSAANGANDTAWCRGMGPVSIGAGKTPSSFIHEALYEELFMAGIYSSTAPLTISGRLDEIKFSSVSPAYWEMAITLKSSNGTSYQTKNRYGFDTSWDAFSACKNVADAFPSAVQELLKQAILDNKFKTLF